MYQFATQRAKGQETAAQNVGTRPTYVSNYVCFGACLPVHFFTILLCAVSTNDLDFWLKISDLCLGNIAFSLC